MGDGVPSWLRSVLKKPQASTTLVHVPAVADAPTIEPSSLARRIQSLIKKLPTTTSFSATETNTETRPQATDEDGQQPSSLVSIDDSNLVQALRSPVIMNGSLPDGMPSIWSVLDGMDPQGRPHNAPEYSHDVHSETFSDTSSVMVYSPLFPAPGSVVELAESEVVIEEESSETEPTPALPLPGWSWVNSLPSVTSWFTHNTPSPTSFDDNNQLLTPRTRERRLRAQRAWVPSKDQLSIQCMWWGYRIFLPPTVLDILDDKQLEATRRAAMITTALTWFFNNLPINVLPLPLRPTLLLVQQIAPFLGSIGTFISWSWGVIKGYDQGHGITLTATWLLPIALIPGTWFERDWPISPLPPTFSPLPSGTATTPSPTDNTVLSTPDHTPRPPPAELIPSPQPTIRALSTPSTPRSTPLPSSFSPIPRSPLTTPCTPVAIPDSPDSPFTVSSPALSFVTAPSSPTPKSPKRIRRSLAGLVAKSPLIHVRHSRDTKQSPSPSNSTPLYPPSSPPPSFALPYQLDPHTPSSFYYPSVISSTTSPHRGSLPPEETYPSPPADPNDIFLLRGPLWQCSPLPPETSLQDET